MILVEIGVKDLRRDVEMFQLSAGGKDILVDHRPGMNGQFFQFGKQVEFMEINSTVNSTQMLEVRKTPKTKGQQTRRNKLVGVSLIGFGDFAIPFVRDTKLMQIV